MNEPSVDVPSEYELSVMVSRADRAIDDIDDRLLPVADTGLAPSASPWPLHVGDSDFMGPSRFAKPPVPTRVPAVCLLDGSGAARGDGFREASEGVCPAPSSITKASLSPTSLRGLRPRVNEAVNGPMLRGLAATLATRLGAAGREPRRAGEWGTAAATAAA